MLSLINWRLKITINDGRAFIGQMLAFDRHMNLVLADCEEFRRVRPKKKPGETEAGPEQEMKRSLGLVILRGETVVSLSVEGPPPVQDDDKKSAVRATPSPKLQFSRTRAIDAADRPSGASVRRFPKAYGLTIRWWLLRRASHGRQRSGWGNARKRVVKCFAGVVDDKLITELTVDDAIDFRNFWRDRDLPPNLHPAAVRLESRSATVGRPT